MENDVFAGTAAPQGAGPFDGASKRQGEDPFKPVTVPQQTIDVFGTDNPQGHGTSDSIKARIPIGSFVLPAAVVSALGRGDTTSGIEALNRALGAPQKSAPMGAIDSYLSRGEYVIPPSKVAEFGQGDPVKGADVLSRYFNVPVTPED